MNTNDDTRPAPVQQLVGRIYDLIKKYNHFRFKSELLFYFKDQSYDSVNEALNMLIMDGKIHRFHDKIFLTKNARDSYSEKYYQIIKCNPPTPEITGPAPEVNDEHK